jgi:hypothetical protein
MSSSLDPEAAASPAFFYRIWLAAIGFGLTAGVLVLGLIANEDDTQDRIHRVLPWSGDRCEPWSVLWLLGGILIAAVGSALLLRSLGRPGGESFGMRTLRWSFRIVAVASVGYWIVNLVGARSTSCIE